MVEKLGNPSTHGDAVEHDRPLDAFELLEMALRRLFEGHRRPKLFGRLRSPSTNLTRVVVFTLHGHDRSMWPPKLRSVFLAFAATAALANPALAYTAADIIRLQKNEFVKLYVQGVGEAYLSSNSALKARNQKPLFCPPPRLAMSHELYVSVIERAVRDKSQAGDGNAAIVLLIGLLDTFPCP